MRKSRSAAVVVASILAFGLSAPAAEAQFPLMISGGPTFTSLSGDDVPDDYGTKTGFFVNVGTAIPIADGALAIMPFVGITQRGATDETDDDEHITLTYIDIPVLLSAAFPVSDGASFSVSAGPRASFMLSCKFEDDGFSEDCEDEKSLDYGLLADAGVRFSISPTTSLGIGAGYDLGLADILDDTSAKNRGFYVRGTASILVGN